MNCPASDQAGAGMPPLGRIFDIQRFSVHDGPGVRTTVFLKGCPLSCRWCSNPESQRPDTQILFFQHLCKGCGACLAACPHGAVVERDDSLVFLREFCTACGACVKACNYEARVLSGRAVTIGELCAILRMDWRVYMQSGGGVTVGGGEALMQAEFLLALLTELHDGLGYHTCLDTTGLAPWSVIQGLLPHLDLMLLDIKHLNPEAHLKMTGVDNALILDNARALSRAKFPVIIRVPLIPGFNDSAAHLHALGEFLRDLQFSDVELMPYHAYGLSKYQALGRTYPMQNIPQPDDHAALEILGSCGLNVVVHQR